MIWVHKRNPQIRPETCFHSMFERCDVHPWMHPFGHFFFLFFPFALTTKFIKLYVIFLKMHFQSHEFSKEPSIQLIMNSIDSNLSAVAGEQCKLSPDAPIGSWFNKSSSTFRHSASESVVDDDWRRDPTERLWHLQLQSRLELRPIRRARIVVELQLLLLQQEVEADCVFQLSSHQVSANLSSITLSPVSKISANRVALPLLR